MKLKSGISLVVLVITIIVMIILTSVAVMGISNVLEGVYEDDFVTELTQIEDKVKEYYITMGTLPVDENTQYTATSVIELLDNDNKKSTLSGEITSNNDTNNIFYKLDIDLLGIQLDERGLETSANDIFLVASDTMTVYYLQGFELQGRVYFSTIGLLESKEVVVQDQNNSIETNLKQYIKLTKSTDAWTNNLNIKVDTDLNDGEELVYYISNDAKYNVPDNRTIVINSLTENEQTAFNEAKSLTVVRRKADNTEVFSNTISIDNLDVLAPTITDVESTVITTQEVYNMVDFKLSDQGGSGVKAIYYDYVTVLNGENIEEAYYTNRTEITKDDLIQFGKVTKDGIIYLAKNIKQIKAVVMDNAGNVSDIITFTIDNTYLTGS